MSERMSERGAGLSDSKKERTENERKQGTPDRFASWEAIQGVWIHMVCAALVLIDNRPGLRIQDERVSARPIAEVKHVIQRARDDIG